MQFDYIILGGTGLVGSAVVEYLRFLGADCLSLHSKNYDQYIGSSAKVVINCNGNSYRFKANQDPKWDFGASVDSVQRSLFDFKTDMYIYMSTIDVYNHRQNPELNHENIPIDYLKLDAYGFHKWVAERLVEKYARNALILRLGTVIGNGLKKGPIFDLLNQNPVFMSLDSKISLVDTQTIARIVAFLIESGVKREIFNITGHGGVKLRDLQPMVPFQFKTQAESLHQYDISNTKIHALYPMPTSLETAQRYIQSRQA
ncbi:MAG TPA: NAD-dependent epimerase/dehydratase family protein [Chlamydiales bacterium]|nr:NAD-dependent epimerase/dehydratase family protein [Chlamydiales bacterium]